MRLRLIAQVQYELYRHDSNRALGVNCDKCGAGMRNLMWPAT
jgi:hypothetical protein